MYFLNEKRVRQSDGIQEFSDMILEKQVCFIERQMDELKKDCMRLYGAHLYGEQVRDYDKCLEHAKEQYCRIQGYDWKAHVQVLDIFKAKAGYFLGCIYVCRQEYDVALCYLAGALQLIEKDTLQCIIPEFYICINIEIAKCYLFKHSPKKKLLDCLENAGKALDEMEKSLGEKDSGQAFFVDRLYIELKMHQAYTDLDKCGSREDTDEAQAMAADGISHSFLTIQGIEAQQALADVEQRYRKLGSNPAYIPQKKEFPFKKWCEKQEEALLTTKGDLFKNLYFLTGELVEAITAVTEKKEDEAGVLRNQIKRMLSDIAGIVQRELAEAAGQPKRAETWMGTEYFMALSDEVSSVKKVLGWTDPASMKKYFERTDFSSDRLAAKAEDLQQYCLAVAIVYFSSVIRIDPKNTISLDDIAALLYDYGRDETERNEFLRSLAEKYFQKFKKDDVSEIVDEILKEVLRIESANMFALNIIAAKSQNDSSDGKVDDYPALRQSALKKWFTRLDEGRWKFEWKNSCEKCDRREVCEKYIVKEVCEKFKSNRAFLEMEVSLVKLYSHVNRFMQSAIIDYGSEYWKGLEIGHYTKMAVLPKLFQKGTGARFRIQNVHHLNDPREGAILIDYLKGDLINSGENSLIDELWSLYDSDQRGAVRNSVYMGSFTSRLDQLGMWERYGDHKRGVALQFDVGFFDREAEISLAEMSTSGGYGKYKRENVKYPLYMVLYLPDKGNLEDSELERLEAYAQNRVICEGEESLEGRWWKKQSELAGKLVRLKKEVVQSLEDIQKNYLDLPPELQKGLKRELCDTVMVILDLVRFLIKSEYYRDEREYRVIQYSSDPECDCEGKVVPRLYIPIERELVYKKVNFGPLVTDFESNAAYILNIKREHEKEEGKRYNIEVRKSSISFKED